MLSNPVSVCSANTTQAIIYDVLIVLIAEESDMGHSPYELSLSFLQFETCFLRVYFFWSSNLAVVIPIESSRIEIKWRMYLKTNPCKGALVFLP